MDRYKLKNIPRQSLDLTLDGIATTIEIFFNEYTDAQSDYYETSGYFTFNIINSIMPYTDSDGNNAINGLTLVTNFPMLGAYQIKNFGDLVLSSETNLNPDIDTLEDNFTLDYYTIEDLELIQDL